VPRVHGGSDDDRGTEAWLEAGRLLVIQREATPHGRWLLLSENADSLGFSSPRAAQRLMEIAENPQLTADLLLI
jgi:hypothetical protein